MAEKRSIAKKRRKYKRELPPVGTSLTCQFKGKEYKALIVESLELPGSSNKLVKYRGNLYRSLSATATAITGFPTNGWRYWKW